MELKYLFECHFKDGTVLSQTQEDLSATDPTRSAFYDVDQRLADVEIFGIYNSEHRYMVDLADGHFEIDGLPFFVHSTEKIDSDALRLVYFRRVKHTVTMGGSPDTDAQSHSIEFHLGWETTVEEQTYRQTIAIK